jgi:hypothetical protein
MNARSVGRKAVSGWSKTGEWSSDSSSLDWKPSSSSGMTLPRKGEYCSQFALATMLGRDGRKGQGAGTARRTANEGAERVSKHTGRMDGVSTRLGKGHAFRGRRVRRL